VHSAGGEYAIAEAYRALKFRVRPVDPDREGGFGFNVLFDEGGPLHCLVYHHEDIAPGQLAATRTGMKELGVLSYDRDAWNDVTITWSAGRTQVLINGEPFQPLEEQGADWLPTRVTLALGADETLDAGEQREALLVGSILALPR